MKKNTNSLWESLFVLILGMYPLRHIYIGVDLWDTGYNYANFQYMGTEHMDSMWLFSTYLANVVGNFLMKLPSAGSLAGMNLYTALFVSILAVTGYLFCTRTLKISPLVAFIGEFAAISLCWCPTAVLYNYLTYVFFLISFILLYKGLVAQRKWCLFAAGIFLGANVLVRFSNLPEAAMIVAVWAYGVLETLEYRETKRLNSEQEKGKSGAWKRTVNRTLWCLAGYLTALIVLLGTIGIRYGLDAYIQGILRLFDMTDSNTEYKATSMLMGVVGTYVENLYWLIRILIIILVGMCGCVLVGLLKKHVKFIAGNATVQIWLERICHGACVLLALAMLGWLYYRKFCSWAFYSYDSMLRPGILFLMLTILIGVVRIFQPQVSKEEKLISGMVVLVVFLTSIGSNNEVLPSMNNLFVAAPYTLWQCAGFVGRVKAKEIKGVVLNPFPAKCIVAAFLSMFLFQSACFGTKFVFAEGTGVQNPTAMVTDNKILKGIQMSQERAEWLSTISAYVVEQGLQGREVLLYGWIPSLSYYLQMPSAFNPWSDLDSYSVEQMEKKMSELSGEIDEKSEERPVVIAEKNFVESLDGMSESMEVKKWKLILDFMEKYGYEQTFDNGKFVIWE